MLEVDMECRCGIFFVRINGILNSETVYKLNDEVLKTIIINGIKYLMLNLEDLYYIDSNGIELLNEISKYIKKYNGKTYVCGINNNIIRNRIHEVKNIIKVNNELEVLKGECL